MIALLTGRLCDKRPEEIVLDVGGVGYAVHVSLRTYADLPDLGSEIALRIHTHVREDAIVLFGFADVRERALFRKLTEVSGIGPKLALAILSGVPPTELERAIRERDEARLVAIPGIGRKTAQRMIVELEEKIGELPPIAGGPPVGEGIPSQAVSALVNLGYARADAERAVGGAGTGALEDVLRAALRGLAR